MKKKALTERLFALDFPHQCVFLIAAAVMVSLLMFFVFRPSHANFSTEVMHTVTGAYASVSADFDGDLDIDLAVTNYAGSGTNGNVSILLNTGTGSFAAPVSYAVGKGPVNVLAVNVDGDGDIDLVVNNTNSVTMSVLKNNGSGVFAAATNFALGGSPGGIAAADIDGDLDFDIIEASQFGADAVYTLLNNGSGTYAAPVAHTAGTSVADVFVADIDGDTDKDIVTANQGGDNISVLKNNGSGTFAAAVNYPAGGTPVVLSGADFDSDGDIDVAVTDFTGGVVSVLLNDGSGVFASAVAYTGGSFLFSIAIADADRDGDKDIILANGDVARVSVLLNNGSAIFSDPLYYTASAAPNAVSTGDFNGDGGADIVATDFAGNMFGVFFQTTNGDMRLAVKKMDGTTALTGASVSYKCTGGSLVTVIDGGTGDDDGLTNGTITRDGARIAADSSLCTAGNPVFTQFDVKKDGYVIDSTIPSNYSTAALNSISRTMTGNYRMKVIKESTGGNATGLVTGNFTFGTAHADFKEIGSGVYDFAIAAATSVTRAVATTGFVSNTGTSTSALSLQPAAQVDDSSSPLSLLYGVKVVVASEVGSPITGLSVSTLRGVVPEFSSANTLYFADTAGAGASLQLSKTGYRSAEVDDTAFSSITTGVGAQVVITLGAYPACVTAPITVSTNCRGMFHLSDGGFTPTPEPTYTVALSSPAGGAMYAQGDSVTIAWATGGTGSVGSIRLSYSTDGITYSSIVENTNNDGLYSWTAPNITSGTVHIKVEATDLVDTLAEDISPSFGIGTAAAPDGVGGGDVTETQEGIDTRGAPIYGDSPFDGMRQEINVLYPGTYFKSENYPAVYYLSNEGLRRPFISAMFFFTWQNSFSHVFTVTPATLSYYSLGQPMLPKPGVVLLKLASSPQVYVSEVDPVNEDKVRIRWIPGEAEAISLFGADWADYIVDIPETFFHDLLLGENITDFSARDTSHMKKRETLR